MPPRDRFQRPLRKLRLSVTDRCNLRCTYCMPDDDYVWLPRREILDFEELARLVDVFTDLGVDGVRITGGEPLLRRDLHRLIAMLAGREAVRDLALTTNGIRLEEQLEDLVAAGLGRLTVSLDTLRPDRFEVLARRRDLERVIAGLRAAAGTRLREQLKIDTVVLREVNDDELPDLIAFGRELGAEVRFIEYMDVGGATRWSEQQVVPGAEMVERLADSLGTPEALPRDAAPADRYRLPDGTLFGIISSTSEPFCGSCDRSRLTADGLWLRCLYAREGLDLRGPLREGSSGSELKELITAAWEQRTDRGAEERLGLSERRPLADQQALRARPHLEMHKRGG